MFMWGTDYYFLSDWVIFEETTDGITTGGNACDLLICCLSESTYL